MKTDGGAYTRGRLVIARRAIHKRITTPARHFKLADKNLADLHCQLQVNMVYDHFSTSFYDDQTLFSAA